MDNRKASLSAVAVSYPVDGLWILYKDTNKTFY